MKRKWMWFAPLAILAMIVFVIVGGEIVMHLWNWLLPPLFGWHVINFWQALALLVLCRILFGGFGGHRSMRSDSRGRMRDRWRHHTPEEREKFRETVREYFGAGPSASQQPGQ